MMKQMGEHYACISMFEMLDNLQLKFYIEQTGLDGFNIQKCWRSMQNLLDTSKVIIVLLTQWGEGMNYDGRDSWSYHPPKKLKDYAKSTCISKVRVVL